MPDAHFSLDEKEFTEMVKAVRTAEKMMGEAEYEMTEKKEEKSGNSLRSLFVIADVKSGDLITEEKCQKYSPRFWHASKIFAEYYWQSICTQC